MASKSVAYDQKSFTFIVTDAGIVKDWPTDTSGHPFATIEVANKGQKSFFTRTGPDSLLGTDVVREFDNSDAHDREFFAGRVVPDFGKKKPTLERKIAFRCQPGESTTVTINPGV